MPKYTGTTVQTQAITFAEPVALDTVNGDFTVTGVIVTNGTPTNSTHAVTKGYVDNSISNLIDSSPAALDTLNELAAALSDDANFATTITNQIALKAPLYEPTFSGTVSGISKGKVGLGNADNTSDADKPISTAAQTAIDSKAPINSPTFTGTVAGVTKSMVGLSNVDNTSDAQKPISNATQTQLDLKAPLQSPAFTGTPTGITKAHVGLSLVDNTSDAHKQAQTLQAATKSDVGLGNVDNTSDASKPVSTDTQTALNLKADINSPTFTGFVSGLTKAMVGLGAVDNTSDSTKLGNTVTYIVTNIVQPTITALQAAYSPIGLVHGKEVTAIDIPATHTSQAMYFGDTFKFGADITLDSARVLFGRVFASVNESNRTYAVTVTNPGSGNIFVLDGVNAPVIELFRGVTYTFDQSDATNASHPIAFKDLTGNSYTSGITSTGTPGQSGAQTVFVVPSNAPNDLRYYCTVHGDSMGSVIQVVSHGGQTITNKDTVSMTISGTGDISHGAVLTTFPS